MLWRGVNWEGAPRGARGAVTGFEPRHPTSITINRNRKFLPRTYILLAGAPFVSGCSGTRAFVWLCCSFFLRDVRLPPARGRQRRAVGGVHARRVQLLPGELALQVRRRVGSRQDLRVSSCRADSSRVVSLISCRTELEGQTPNPAQLCFGCFHRVSWRFDPKKNGPRGFFLKAIELHFDMLPEQPLSCTF